MTRPSNVPSDAQSKRLHELKRVHKLSERAWLVLQNHAMYPNIQFFGEPLFGQKKMSANAFATFEKACQELETEGVLEKSGASVKLTVHEGNEEAKSVTVPLYRLTQYARIVVET